MTDEPPIPELDAGQHGVLEEFGVAFDPGGQHLDLSKEEKRRTTALLLAIQGYRELIIRDADYLREVAFQGRTNPELVIRPATVNGIVDAAMKFDDFIAGKSPPAAAGGEGHAQAEQP